jgi:surface polysaccharide O-acyltransferase-like enzyme
MIMNLSECTADAAIYILSGELPLESFIHSQILLDLCSIIKYGGIEKELCVRQVLIKDVSSHSWFLYAKEILDFYDLPSVFELISVTPAKEKWKTCIKNKIHEYWKMQIEKWSVGKSTIRYLIPRTKENGTVHNVWKNAG